MNTLKLTYRDQPLQSTNLSSWLQAKLCYAWTAVDIQFNNWTVCHICLLPLWRRERGLWCLYHTRGVCKKLHTSRYLTVQWNWMAWKWQTSSTTADQARCQGFCESGEGMGCTGCRVRGVPTTLDYCLGVYQSLVDFVVSTIHNITLIIIIQTLLSWWQELKYLT